MPAAAPVSNGWTLFAYPTFSAAFNDLVATVYRLENTSPKTYASHPKRKLLARILDLVLIEIPRDPNAASYQLGNTMGAAYRHWRRAKFLGRFRLFFRFNSAQKLIVYAWVNDESAMRKAGARTDPYAVFAKKLQAGDPPDDWAQLVRLSAPLPTRPRTAGSPPKRRPSSKFPRK